MPHICFMVSTRRHFRTLSITAATALLAVQANAFTLLQAATDSTAANRAQELAKARQQLADGSWEFMLMGGILFALTIGVVLYFLMQRVRRKS